MPDTIEERLAELGTSLEDLAGIGSPSLIRGRGEHLRVAHRRRVALTATTAAVVIIGAGSMVALRPGGHQPAPVSPGSPDRSVSAPRVTGTPASSSSPAPAASATTAVSVDLKQHKMTVTKDGKVMRTILVTAGTAAHPTATGTFTVTDKLEKETLTSPPTSSGTYQVTVYSVIKLDANGPQMYAGPWNDGKFGKIDASHGDIEMSNDDATWLYATLKVGDRVQVQ
ncbi:MAG: L,D-transpeptidase [Catenulispora sp.]|nr:L,D-transpeptidase [Catenulispora sp.]